MNDKENLNIPLNILCKSLTSSVMKVNYLKTLSIVHPKMNVYGNDLFFINW